MTEQAKIITILGENRPLNLWNARLIIHSPEGFTRRVRKEAVAFILAQPECDDEDRFWADAAAY